MESSGPLIVQGDRSLLLEVDHPRYEEARDCLAAFAELLKSPEYIHTYQITPLSLWNAASAGHTLDYVLNGLASLSRYAVPEIVKTEVAELMSRYGKVKLLRANDGSLELHCSDEYIFLQITRHPKLLSYFVGHPRGLQVTVAALCRGTLKNELIKLGFPAEDLAGYTTGIAHALSLRSETLEAKPLILRSYQQSAADTFYSGGTERGGSGVIVLPCGAGKTLVGMACMAKYGCQTLIVTTNVVAARQWIRELLDKTTLNPEDVGEYNGLNKNLKPITVATYQILTYRNRKTETFPHFEIFNQKNWGLIIYDEVHLLPAPLFRVAADMQATRRLGLTATLIREDGKETDVFALIGPKKYDVPWKALESQGWIATVKCIEIKLPLPSGERIPYAVAPPRDKVTLSACNSLKDKVVSELLDHHRSDQVLIIGQYLDQLNRLAQTLQFPLITGQTPNEIRFQLFAQFRSGELPVLIVSKIGNFAIDLPDANVLIQISGTFGSRQEEAQRLGRILRPKSHGRQALFYTLVTQETRDQDFAMNRQLFLAEQGYTYETKSWSPIHGFLKAKTEPGAS